MTILCSGALQTTNLGYLNPLLKTYSIALALGYTRHPCSKKRGRLYVSIPLIGGGVSSYAYSLRECGRFLLLLKVCLNLLIFYFLFITLCSFERLREAL